MADDKNKLASKKKTPVQQKNNEIKALKKRVAELEDALDAEQATSKSKIRTLESRLAQAAKRGSAKPRHDAVYLDGEEHKILLRERADEIGRAVLRSEVDEDATVVVLDRHGA